MKNFYLFISLFILGSCGSQATDFSNGKYVFGISYYVDSNTGNDSNTGFSPKTAWASLEKINSVVFEPGDRILLKAGTEYQGQLEPKGNGNELHPILINRYGTGKNPAIHGFGEKLHTLLLHNVEYWEIRNLEITNTGNEPQGRRRGVIVSAEDFGECHHIVLDSLEIHHVNGDLVKKKGGGSAIYWRNSGKSVKTRFVGLVISNCYLHHCERNGINSGGYTNRDDWFPTIGVHITNNLLEQIPGDGIVPIGCDGALIEYNIMRDCPETLGINDAAAGMWPWGSDNTIIQFNEVSGHNAQWDGQGFDSDWNCQNTIIQYNYSHDNIGGFLLVCNNGASIGSSNNIGTKNTIVRYNVSINDGIRAKKTRRPEHFSPTMHISGPCEGTKIYNNIFIVPEKIDPVIDRTLVEMDNWGGPWPTDTWFANNIFMVEGKSRFFWGEAEKTLFTNNCFNGDINNLPEDAKSIYENPGFVNDQARGDGFEVLKNFMLKKDSPLLKKGVIIGEEGMKDIFGNGVPNDQQPNIGIH